MLAHSAWPSALPAGLVRGSASSSSAQLACSTTPGASCPSKRPPTPPTTHPPTPTEPVVTPQVRTVIATSQPSFIGTILAANYVTTEYGMVPVGFGLVATAGTYFAGLAFVLRDTVQDLLGKWTVLALVVAGASLSYLVSDPFIALAVGCRLPRLRTRRPGRLHPPEEARLPASCHRLQRRRGPRRHRPVPVDRRVPHRRSYGRPDGREAPRHRRPSSCLSSPSAPSAPSATTGS